MSASPWPIELRVDKARQILNMSFDDGMSKIVTSEKLRVESPSAEVQGHTPSQKVHVVGKENVKIMNIEPVGHYAVRITFDDGHNTGIYTWKYLYELGENK